MNKRSRKLLVLILSCILIVAGTAMAIAATASDFKVVVNTDKDSYAEGEDILMSIEIENNAADGTVTDVLFYYNIPENITDNVVDYDKLPEELDALNVGTTVVFSTIPDAVETETTETETTETESTEINTEANETESTGINAETNETEVDEEVSDTNNINDTESPATGVDDNVMLFAGIMMVAVGVVIAVRAAGIRKFTSMFTVMVMIVGFGSSLSLTAEAAVDEFLVKGAKTITYAGEEMKILVSAGITIEYNDADSEEESSGETEEESSRETEEESGGETEEESGGETEVEVVSGTELAKLLLANERLDSEKLTEDGKLFEKANITESIAKLNYVVLSTVDASEYIEYSSMMSFFESYINVVKLVTERAADRIDYMKENVSYTGVWIPCNGDTENMLLEVTDNEEWLLIKNDVFSFVCRRYTDNNGNDIYEMCQTETDGSYTYLRCMPEKLYEYSFYWADGSDIHVIADNSRGYWNMFTTYEDPGEVRHAQNLVAADDFAYVYFGAIGEDGCTFYDYIPFIEPNLKCDLITVCGNDVDIQLVGYNGIESIAVEDNVITSFTTTNGDIIEKGDRISEDIIFSGGSIEALATPYATLRFVNDDDSKTAQDVIDVLADLGVTCKYDLTNVLSGIDTSYAIINNFGNYYSWNGYYVKDAAAVQSAIGVEKDRYTELMSVYETAQAEAAVKETSTGIDYVNYDFAELTLTGSEAVAFENGIVTISGLGAEVAAADVMMNDEIYELQFALAELSDTDGKYDSTILLSSETDGAETYSGEALTLTKSAQVTIPDCMQTGDYTFVVYAATSEGIRVSKMVPVVFTSEVPYTNAANGYETSAQLNADSELLVCYTPTNEYEAVMPEQDSYTYEEVLAYLSTESMKYGYPDTEAVLEVYDEQTGAVLEVSEGDVLSGCVCKLQYSIPDTHGLVTGYVYTQLP